MTTTEPQDQGTSFGTWDDPVAAYMYRESVPEWVAGLKVDTMADTVDLGGANGLLRSTFPRLLTVDADPAKRPDVVADAAGPLAVPASFRQAVARYLLHYLNDAQVAAMARHTADWADRLYVVQFVADPAAKDANSAHEPARHWRTAERIAHLVTAGSRWHLERTWTGTPYTVTPSFYEARLGPAPAGRPYTPHQEHIVALALTKEPPA